MRAGPGGGLPRPRPAPPGARAPVQRRFPGDADDGGAAASADPTAALAAVRDGIGTGLEWGLECLADPSDLVFDWIAGTCAAPPRAGAKPAALLARVVRHDDDAPADAEEPETPTDGPRVRERPGACALRGVARATNCVTELTHARPATSEADVSPAHVLSTADTLEWMARGGVGEAPPLGRAAASAAPSARAGRVAAARQAAAAEGLLEAESDEDDDVTPAVTPSAAAAARAGGGAAGGGAAQEAPPHDEAPPPQQPARASPPRARSPGEDRCASRAPCCALLRSRRCA